MSISLKPERLKRYRDVARLLWKYGRSDVVKGVGLREAVAEDPPEEADDASELADDLEAGLVLASLIVGAAMLVRVDTAFTLFGYPGLAMLCFLVAAVGGLALVVDIALHDWRSRGPRK